MSQQPTGEVRPGIQRDERPGTAPQTRPETRTRALALAGVLIGGLGCLIAGSQPWWRARGDGGSVTFSGTDATAGLTQALGVVALVGGVLALALRHLGRRILGVLLVLAGAGIVVLGVLRLRPGASAVQDKVRQVSLMDDYTLDPTFWNYGYAVAGLIVVLGAGLMVLRARRWPTRADRFRRQAELVERAELAGAGTDPTLWWKAQDAGADPTVSPNSGLPSSGGSADPDSSTGTGQGENET